MLNKLSVWMWIQRNGATRDDIRLLGSEQLTAGMLQAMGRGVRVLKRKGFCLTWMSDALFLFFLGFLKIYLISNVTLFPGFLSITPLSQPPSSIRVCPHPSTHLPLWLSPTPGDPALAGQGLLLPLVPNKAILCYTCSWSHGSVHVYSLDGG